MNEWKNERNNGNKNKIKNDRMIEWRDFWMKERMNKILNEWKNEILN